MLVTAVHVLIDASGRRRGRLCQRGDGRWQFVTERLVETSELSPHWTNDQRPSGLFENAIDAAAALRADLGGAVLLESVEPCIFDIRVGPYPEPTLKSP